MAKATKAKTEEVAAEQQTTMTIPTNETVAAEAPAAEPKVIKNVIIPPVNFPQRPATQTAKPASMEELKKVIIENLTANFSDLQLVLMPHYRIDDQHSSKMVKVALRELVAEKKIAVDSTNFERLATAHYPDTTTGQTHYWLLKDIAVKAKLV